MLTVDNTHLGTTSHPTNVNSDLPTDIDIDSDEKKRLTTNVKQTKLTFKPASVPAVKENIRMFQRIA